jgi:hypothetical protein
MKKRFIKAQEKDVAGTSFVGYILSSYDNLVKHLGKPKDMYGMFGDWKTKAEWSFKTRSAKPTVITIYDYKEIIPVSEIYTWHVGMKGNHNLLDVFLKEKGLTSDDIRSTIKS